MKQTAVEWLVEQMKTYNMTVSVHNTSHQNVMNFYKAIEQAKEMEKNDTDNKAIHFAEWLTNKHTGVLITLYERFEEEHYKSE